MLEASVLTDWSIVYEVAKAGYSGRLGLKCRDWSMVYEVAKAGYSGRLGLIREDWSMVDGAANEGLSEISEPTGWLIPQGVEKVGCPKNAGFADRLTPYDAVNADCPGPLERVVISCRMASLTVSSSSICMSDAIPDVLSTSSCLAEVYCWLSRRGEDCSDTSSAALD